MVDSETSTLDSLNVRFGEANLSRRQTASGGNSRSQPLPANVTFRAANLAGRRTDVGRVLPLVAAGPIAAMTPTAVIGRTRLEPLSQDAVPARLRSSSRKL